MSRFNKLLANFSLGELSPRFYGRKDLEEYSKGAELFDNFIPMVEGGFTRRMGSEYVADLASFVASTVGPALIPFVVSKNEAYLITINFTGASLTGSDLIKVYKNDGTVPTFTSFNFAVNPPVVDPKGFQYSKVGDVMVITHSSGTIRPFIIYLDSTTGNFGGADYLRYAGVITPATPFVELLNNPFANVPYRDVNITATTLAISATSGSITVTASTALFAATHVGSYFRAQHGTTTGIFRVVTYISPTSVGAVTMVTFGATTATTNWEESSWSDYRGYPRTVVAHEQRFVFGGNLAQKDTIWASRLGGKLFMMQKRLAQDINSGADTSGINYFIDTNIPDGKLEYANTGVNILESDPFSFTLASQEVNPITWLKSKRNLLIGTAGAEYVVSSQNGFSILTIQVVEQTNHGGAPVRPLGQGHETLFMSRDGHTLRAFKYNDSNGSFTSGNLSITADHMRKLQDTIDALQADNYEFIELCYQQSEEIIWLRTSSNTLVGFVYSKENGTLAWFRTTFTNVTDIWGFCSIPNANGGSDDLWVSLERTVDGAAEFYLERIGPRFNAATLEETNTAVEENLPRFLDSHVKIDNSGTSITDTVSGLDHLDGETVKFMYRGEDLGDYEVTAGDITLSAAAQLKVDVAGFGFVGVEYTSNFQSLDVEAGGDLGFSEGHTQRIERADIRYFQTKAARVGSPDRQDPQTLVASSSPQVLYSGITEVRMPISPDKDQKIKIVVNTPQPCTVLAIALRGSTDD